MKKRDANNNSPALWVLLVGIPIVAAIVYFKLAADEVTVGPVPAGEERLQVAVPDTSTTAEIQAEDADAYAEPVAPSDSVGVDTRPPMEAGDEDGYWDGWYDGAETGERLRYDDKSGFASEQDRKTYAENYREGYEKGFSEALKRKSKP